MMLEKVMWFFLPFNITGIMSKWYDACVGYVSIPERLNSMAFTDAYANAVATFTVLKGNPRNFNPDNVSESVISKLN